MIKHFAADGTVKREWPEGLHASGFEQDGKRFAIVAKSNAVETVELADGEQVGEAALASGDMNSEDVAHILDALEIESVSATPDPEPSDIVMGTGPDATPMIETELGDLVPAPVVPNAPQSVVAIAVPSAIGSITEQHVPQNGIVIPAAILGSTTVHHVPSPSEVVETAAHALNDAAEVLKQEEARNAAVEAQHG